MEKAEAFEHKYNFRFEEPDPDFVPFPCPLPTLPRQMEPRERFQIKAYPRTVKESLRRPETRRAEQRQAYKERKKRVRASQFLNLDLRA